MSIKNDFFFIPIIFILFLNGCQVENNSHEIIFSITSPIDGWTYYEDTKVLLALNIDTHEISWSSSIDGYLGTGNHLLSYLSTGCHEITADVLSIKKTVDVTITEKTSASGTENKTLINYSPLERMYPKGRYFPLLLTLDGSVNGFRKENVIPESRAQYRANFNEQSEFIKRDLRFDIKGKHLITANSNVRMRIARSLNPALGDSRIFYVPNTNSFNALPHEVSAILFYSSDKINVWIPDTAIIDQVLLLECIARVETSILPRLEQIWGDAADIDEDGRLAILVSKTINDENVAIGFFNPADFYRRETDINSDAYNPVSNEMDIIYIAVPDNTIESYNKDSIISTITHEITHAITYAKKTWQREMTGQDNAKREELFLDEGLSHLSEVLCGIGYSGGTVKYLQRYFENTAHYSLCDKDIYGQFDSVGMRGAITLFLSWLFWKKGGMVYAGTDSNTIMDNGGIGFLKLLVESEDTGWENIGKIAGTSTDKLFEEMLVEINHQRRTNIRYQYRADKTTGEPIELFPDIHYSNTTIDFPARYDINRPINLGRWSFVLFEPFAMENTGIITLLSTNQIGKIFFISNF